MLVIGYGEEARQRISIPSYRIGGKVMLGLSSVACSAPLMQFIFDAILPRRGMAPAWWPNGHRQARGSNDRKDGNFSAW